MAKQKESDSENESTIKAEDHVKRCGIIMPIADNPKLDYPLGHWRDVLNIIEEAFDDTEFTPSLVSKKDSVGLIHESIVTNIYSNEIVVCDVSTKNPNVMFELGMRLAFDKPVIIIKDEKTDYSFDTGPIEHLNYPSSLRFQDIVSFKRDLKSRAIATFEASKDPNFSPYLKSFKKTIVPGKIETVEVTDLQFIVDSIKSLNFNVDKLTEVSSKGQTDLDSSTTLSFSDQKQFGEGVVASLLRRSINDILRAMNAKDISSISIERLVLLVEEQLPGSYTLGLSPRIVRGVIESEANRFLKNNSQNS